jgi:hypothetical protein
MELIYFVSLASSKAGNAIGFFISMITNVFVTQVTASSP